MAESETSKLFFELPFDGILSDVIYEEKSAPKAYRRKSSTQLFRLHRMMLASDAPPKTFSLQDSLLSLPVPNLYDTVDKYLASASALVSGKELAETKALWTKFVDSRDADILQDHLLDRSDVLRNWVEEWWYDAYNETRLPLPLQNMGSVIPRSRKEGGGQLETAAEFSHYLMRYWIDLRKENIPITSSRKEIWDMDQLHNVFNSCRSAALPKDELRRFFLTEEEGDAPSHVAVISDGAIFKVDMVVDDKLLSIGCLYKIFQDIQSRSKQLATEYSLVPLTTEHRDIWAELRQEIIQFSQQNRENVDLIESAAFVVSLTNEKRTEERDLMFYSLFGNPRVCWCDKNFSVAVMADGQICYNADHCNVDAISLFTPADFAAAKLGTELWETEEDTPFPEAVLLQFDLPLRVKQAIPLAENHFSELADSIDLQIVNYPGFGNNDIKTHGMYADTIIQIAIQLAYFKKHQTFAPTYETASTRRFFHGRTETVRSCTPAFVDFGNAAMSSQVSVAELQKLFHHAYDAHNKIMEEARNGLGIDRHLYGLRKTYLQLKSEGEDISLHGIFDDPSWTATGGNGNFKLSTSFLGYDPEGTFGYVAAMCADGYGCFYRINPHSITFTVTCFKNQGTSTEEFAHNLTESLDFLLHLIKKT